MKRFSVLASWISRLHRRSVVDIGIRLFPLGHLKTFSRQRNEAVIRQLCANAYLGVGRSLCRVLGRYKMIVDPTDVGLSSHLLLDGYWEMWLTELLAEIVRPGMIVVDVGANLGYFTLLMADLVGPNGKVYAFEANSDLAQRMRHSVAINGFQTIVNVYEQALADGDENVLLVVPAGEPKNGHLLPATHPIGTDGNTECRLMQTRRLDSYIEVLEADLIKIDADGSELAIWKGMTAILQSGRDLIIVLEFARVRYGDPGAFLDCIVADGFTLAEITLDAGVQPTTRDAILSAPSTEDVMLLLVR